MSNLSLQLQQQLKNNKISMYKLAKDLKHSKQTIINWCNGTNEPKASQIIELCKYFDVSADYLLGLEER